MGLGIGAIASPQALLDAWRAYRGGKRRRPDVAAFELSAEMRLLALSDALLAGAWRHGRYRVLKIRDPKARIIAVASVADRVLHQSVHRAVAPFFQRRYITDSYACLPGRGSHRALLRFIELIRRHRYFVHLDIHRYFATVDHRILRSILAPRIRRAEVMAVLDEILSSGAALYRRPSVARFFGLDVAALAHRPTGLPIGNLTSQEWGNLYLDGLDQHLKRVVKVAGYLRYMDDFVCFADDRQTLRAWREEIVRWLRDERRLELTPGSGEIRRTTRPHVFLGHKLTRGGWELGPKAIRRFGGKLPRLVGEMGRGGTDERIERSMKAWLGAMSF